MPDAALRKARAAALANPNTRAAAEEWLRELNVPLVDVWFLRVGSSDWIEEKHVNDIATIDETIMMTMNRLGCFYALHLYQGRWRLVGRRHPSRLYRYYDTREAAEMVAIHNG
jgi:hypothetical protein